MRPRDFGHPRNRWRDAVRLGMMLLLAPLPGLAQEICTWRPVENAGINSHLQGQPWCFPGEFMVAFDLDGPRKYQQHDSPVVGQAYCCATGSGYWSRLENWRPVSSSNVLPLERQTGWCSPGSFLVALDLDGPRNLSAHDSPVIGAALCAFRDPPSSKWGNTFDWEVEIYGYNSHQPFGRWCPEGSYLIAIDQDSRPGYAAHDSPVIGRVRCATP